MNFISPRNKNFLPKQFLSRVFRKQGAISILITVLILSNLLVIALGVSFLLLSQIKMSQNAGESVRAFYAADAGAERCLFDMYTGTKTSCSFSYSYPYPANYVTLDNGAVASSSGFVGEGLGYISSLGCFNSQKKICRAIELNWQTE
jgi:hypothetical protein